MSSIDYIIAGLGNPDKKHHKTRHNVGFMVLDYVTEKFGAEFTADKFKSLCTRVRHSDKNILFLKPQTYMNLSGHAVLSAMSFYKVLPEKVILIFDDISLPVGKIRIREKGSHGGHNGVKSILDLCSCENFPRIKVGIGEKPNSSWDLADWVLSKFSGEELDVINESMQDIYEAVCLIAEGKIGEAMNKFN